MTVTEEEAAKRARRGAAWLDVHHPGWENEVELPRLNVQSCYDCVLGQIYGEYEKGRDWWSLTSDDGAYLGFATTRSEAVAGTHVSNRVYTTLTEEWRRLILARRAAAAKSPGSAAEHVLVA